MSGLAIDSVTILRCTRNCRATKLVTGLLDGSVRVDAYDAGKFAAVTESQVASIAELAQALDEADLRLSRQADDPHLREVAVLAARSHVEHLLEVGTSVADVAAWLEDQLSRRPYLRPALQGRLAELQAESRRSARPPGKN